MTVAMKPCPACGRTLSLTAYSCPTCGHSLKRLPGPTTGGEAVLVLLTLALVVAVGLPVGAVVIVQTNSVMLGLVIGFAAVVAVRYAAKTAIGLLS